MTIAIQSPTDTFPGVSRRNFLKRAGAAGLAVSAASVVAISAPASALAGLSSASAQLVPAYSIDYPPSVRVHVTDGQRFDVTVTDLDGYVIETHRNLSAQKLPGTTSAYFTVTAITPPS